MTAPAPTPQQSARSLRFLQIATVASLVAGHCVWAVFAALDAVPPSAWSALPFSLLATLFFVPCVFAIVHGRSAESRTAHE